MPDTLNILIKNTSKGNLYAFLSGKYNDRLCIIRADGRTQYFPGSPGATVQPLAENCAIYIGPPGATKTLQIPYLSAARIYFSIDVPLDFYLNPGPNLVEPSVANPSDTNINKVWTFAEFTFNKDQLYANITYVDFVSIPVALSLKTATDKTVTVKGLAYSGLDAICSQLEQQHRVDGAPWDQLIVKTPDGTKNLRVLSPNLARVGKPYLFGGYFESYVSQAWDRFKKEPLAVDTQSQFGVTQGRVVNEVLTFPGVGTYPKPSTGDIFSNSTGPFRTDTEGYRALTPRIAAAFNRSELLLANAIPADPCLYYKAPVTNHYSRILHQVNLDSRGYAFPYDDVTKTGGADLSGAVFDPNPALLTVTVGGTDAPLPAFDAKSHIRAERFSSQNGVKTEVTSDTEAGNNVGWICNGDWIAFDRVNFDNYGVDTFNIRVASGQGGDVKGRIELRLDSLSGPTIASVEVANTGGWQSWTTKSAKLNTALSGVHAVYLAFVSNRVEDFTNINWFTFAKSAIVVPPDPTPTGGAYKTVGYYVNWAIYGRKFKPQDLQAEKLTHINYAFANVQADGTVFLTDTWSDTDIHFPPNDSWNDPGYNCYGCLKQLYLLKKRNRKLKVLLSVGGWTYSGSFPPMASTPQGRQRFAQSAVQLVKDCGFDGIDIDWEYPTDANQAQNFVDLLRELRAQLSAYSAQTTGGKYRFLITVACPAGPSNYTQLKIREMDAQLDFWNLMAYDLAGSWDATTGHQANLFRSAAKPASTKFAAAEAIDYYLANGVKPAKLVLGMPLYGRAFCNTAGPGEAYNGIGPADMAQGSWEAGVWDYKALPRAGAVEMLDKDIVASWSYDPDSRMMISYDTVDCARKKAEYIKTKKLGGAMWWETSGDKAGLGKSLIGTVVTELGGVDIGLDKTENCLGYPMSKFDNIRNGCSGE